MPKSLGGRGWGAIKRGGARRGGREGRGGDGVLERVTTLKTHRHAHGGATHAPVARK